METKVLHIASGHPNRPGKVLSKVTGVVVHWTANEGKGADAVANRNYFNRQWKGTLSSPKEMNGSNFSWASCHLNVDDHQLVECLPWQKGVAEMAYHVGGNYKPEILTQLDTTYPNDCTIGLEICVNSDGNFAQTWWNATKVVAMMLHEHGLGMDALIRHYDVTGKECPKFFIPNTSGDSYAAKYLGEGWNAWGAYESFKYSVGEELKLLNNPTPAYYKVYQNGQLYKYQFNTVEGAIDCADMLFRESGGTDGSIYVETPWGTVGYNPLYAPEKFPEFQKSDAEKFVDGLTDQMQRDVYEVLKKKFG